MIAALFIGMLPTDLGEGDSGRLGNWVRDNTGNVNKLKLKNKIKRENSLYGTPQISDDLQTKCQNSRHFLKVTQHVNSTVKTQKAFRGVMLE